MRYHHLKGNRKFEGSRNDKSINIFFMTLVFPTHSGYTKRMELLIDWASSRFKTVNFIVPVNTFKIDLSVLEENLRFCDNLYLIKTNSLYLKHFYSILSIVYRILTGYFPKFDSKLFLERDIIIGFKKVAKTVRADYFLNTRHNFAGLVSCNYKNTIPIIDTQDIFTEMHKNHGLANKPSYLKKILFGYKEKEILLNAECEILQRYKNIIAISESDYYTYKNIDVLKYKVSKIEFSGVNKFSYPTAIVSDKEYDLFIVASDFYSTQKGITWFFLEVAQYFTQEISLCVVGSICNYIMQSNLEHKSIKLKLEGYVNNIDNYYVKSKIVPICIFEATGTSIKGLEAMAYGACIVSTSQGVRFGGIDSGHQAIITDNPKLFAESIEQLLIDKQKRNEYGRSAWLYYEEFFSKKKAFEELDNVFNF